MTSRIRWAQKALTDMGRLDPPTRERVLEAVEALAAQGKGDIRRLRGSPDEWRFTRRNSSARVPVKGVGSHPTVGGVVQRVPALVDAAEADPRHLIASE